MDFGSGGSGEAVSIAGKHIGCSYRDRLCACTSEVMCEAD
jgi:hypothetical protein